MNKKLNTLIAITLVSLFAIVILGSLFHTIGKRLDAQDQAQQQFIQDYKAEIAAQKNKDFQP